MEETRDWLRGAGLRPTEPRAAVLEALSRAECPLSHGEILSRLRGGFDRVTLYRVLSAFERVGLAHGIRGTDGVLRYRLHGRERVGCPGNHPHFLCTVCGRMICLAGPPLPRVEVPPGAEILGKQFLVLGRCPECAGASEASGDGGRGGGEEDED